MIQFIELTSDLKTTVTVKKSLIILRNIHVAQPCSASWESMSGDIATRHCEQCDHRVHDLTAMTAKAAAALLERNSGDRICVRFSREADGTVRTRQTWFRRWVQQILLTGGSWLGVALLTGCDQQKQQPPPMTMGYLDPVRLSEGHPMVCHAPVAKTSPDAGADAEVKAKIAVLEAQVAQSQRFDWTAHNELRDLYLRAGDEKKSIGECDIIFRNSTMDAYTLNCLSSWTIDKEPNAAIEKLLVWPDRYPESRFVAAACLLKAAQLSNDSAVAAMLANKVLALRGTDLAPYHNLAASANLGQPITPSPKS